MNRQTITREGALIAQDSPSALKNRTGTDSMDAAFLGLIREERAA